MDVLIFVVVLAALTAFVAAPLYRRRSGVPEVQPSRHRYDDLIGSLRELEVDHTTGTLDDETYAAERARLESAAAALLREESHPTTSPEQRKNAHS